MKNEEGFTGIPITDSGKLGGKLLGIITSRDIDFKLNDILEEPLENLMTKFESLICANDGISLEDAIKVLEKNKKGKLPIVDKLGNLTALMSRTDVKKRRDYPLASKDSNNQLLVGAAIGTRDSDRDRLKKLAEAGVDVIILVSNLQLQISYLDFGSPRIPPKAIRFSKSTWSSTSNKPIQTFKWLPAMVSVAIVWN